MLTCYVCFFLAQLLVILQMRIYALYLLNKKVAVAMVTLWVLTTASSAVIMGVVLNGLEGTHRTGSPPC
jgi:hypothetical protein